MLGRSPATPKCFKCSAPTSSPAAWMLFPTLLLTRLVAVLIYRSAVLKALRGGLIRASRVASPPRELSGST